MSSSLQPLSSYETASKALNSMNRTHLAVLYDITSNPTPRSSLEVTRNTGLPFHAVDSAIDELESVGYLNLAGFRSGIDLYSSANFFTVSEIEYRLKRCFPRST